ncbi:MAG: dihydrofolate reductase [Bacteroidota bacterium]|nr:dihydrofolate reductase [Bacteroidota bacterium]
MNNIRYLKHIITGFGSILILQVGTLNARTKEGEKPKTETSTVAPDNNDVIVDRFADLQVLRYKIDGFDDLTPQQKLLSYYLYEAALSGRDIIYDQKYKYNLIMRRTLDAIITSYNGDKSSTNWINFEVFAKRVWFSNGIHHHYSQTKMFPEFESTYWLELIKNSDKTLLPIKDKSVEEYSKFISEVVLSRSKDLKLVNLDNGVDNIALSANNFYEGVTQLEVEAYYANIKDNTATPIMYGLNSKLIKENGVLLEKTWKVGGMYTEAIEKIVFWLDKAVLVAENPEQKEALVRLIKFYRSGNLKDFDLYNIAWVKDVNSSIDLTNGFIEVYGDALGKRGSYESVLSIKDMVATKTIKTIGDNAQYFEDNSPIMPNHKKKNVKGITAKVITVIVESGDAAPATPIGINLPNSNWIREQHGSKSVSLGNIVKAYNLSKNSSPDLVEFYNDPAVIERIRKYGAIAGDLHTDMHEVIGHASGKINEGIGTPDLTLKNYANTLEEARADLVGLYYILDQKLVDLGVMPSIEVGKAQFDIYINNGLILQLNRINLGDNIEEAHMRNRQLIAAWAFEKGMKAKVITKFTKKGKTYYKINDYNKLRELFGELLKEIQRIKSEGDFAAGSKLVETYGVKVDQKLLKEVKDRFSKLNIAPYKGFMQPKLVAVYDGNGNVSDVKVQYPDSYKEQMLEYGKKYNFLPNMN